MIIKNESGYSYISERTGRTYDLLECFTLGGKYTSDVIAIFYSGNVDTGESSQIIGHYWGAMDFQPDAENETIVKEIIERYENDIK